MPMPQVARHFIWIQLDADSIFLPAKHLHLRYPADGRDTLCHYRFCIFIHGVDRQRIGTEAQEDDWTLGRIPAR